MALKPRILLLLSILALFSFCSGEVIKIYDSDMKDGTYIINKPGYYMLMEDVEFNPNGVASTGKTSYESGDVLPSQMKWNGGKYDPAHYGVGFFAAIAIEADDVVLDLNGKTMTQSKEHALLQRFYAHIETANMPFVPTQGPHDFGTKLVPARNLVIKNGIMARTSHHAIHGNGNYNVTIQDLVIYDYEVAGISLNGAVGLTIKNVHMKHCRYDVPILGLFSAGRFIRPYINYLVDRNSDTTITVQGKTWTAVELRDELKKTLNNVYEDVITKNLGFIDKVAHPTEYGLFHNRYGLVDGNAYGLLLHRIGVAVNGFPLVPKDPASHVIIENVIIENHAADTHEVPALQTTEGTELLDPVGSVWQVFNRHPDTLEPITITSFDLNAAYKGNIISNVQLLVAKALIRGEFEKARLGTRRMKFNKRIIHWAETPGLPLHTYTKDYPVFCSSDTMFHVSKGVIGMKLDASYAVSVSNVRVSNITNYGPKGIEGICPYTKWSKSNYQATTLGYQGADTRGFSFSGSVNVTVRDSEVSGIHAFGGSAFGFDVMTDSSGVVFENCRVEDVRAGYGYDSVSEFALGPTRVPEAWGIHANINSSHVYVEATDCDHFEAIGDAGDIFLEGKKSVVDGVEIINPSRPWSSSDSTVLAISTISVLLITVLLF